MFAADGANVFLAYWGFSFTRASLIVRSVAELYFIFLLFQKKQSVSVILKASIIVVIFFIGAWSAVHSYRDYHFSENFFMVNKMIFFFITLEVFRQYFKSPRVNHLLFKTFEVLIFVEVLTIIIGFIFNLEVFYSYDEFVRFGYKGLIPAQNETSGFFIIAFFYFANQVRRSRRSIWKLLLVGGIGLLTGTKVSLLMPALLVVFIGYWLKYRPQLALKLFIVSMFIVAAALFYKDYILNVASPTIDYIQYKVEKEGLSWLYVLTGGRNALVTDIVSSFTEDADIVNYLFGGYDVGIRLTESDVVDVFLHLGLIGGIFFYVWYMQSMFFSTKINATHLLFVVIWIGVSIAAGHLVYSAINGTYLAILIYSFIVSPQKSRRPAELQLGRLVGSVPEGVSS